MLIVVAKATALTQTKNKLLQLSNYENLIQKKIENITKKTPKIQKKTENITKETPTQAEKDEYCVM
jgi:hypothetical protein